MSGFLDGVDLTIVVVNVAVMLVLLPVFYWIGMRVVPAVVGLYRRRDVDEKGPPASP